MGFDIFTQAGTKPGRVIVKSAGNERRLNGHARLTLANTQKETLRWSSSNAQRDDDLLEAWFDGSMDMNFWLVAPDGLRSGVCNRATPEVSLTSRGLNVAEMRYIESHGSNGSSLLAISIGRGKAASIESGNWSLEMEAVRVHSAGVIDVWLERLDIRATEFLNHQSDQVTLSIPGTAESVITVAAVNSQLPLVSHENSSCGLTRDDRKKPDLAAPGTRIRAAMARSPLQLADKSGTSMAAPHVTGAIALALSHRAKQAGKPWLTSNQIRGALVQHAHGYTGFHSPAIGYGLLDAYQFFMHFYS